MRLSKNFVLSEITRSNTSKRLGIDNEPTKQHLENLQRIVTNLLQPLRDHLGPIRVSSGYRSKELNRVIGGSNKSQHCKGEALDIQFWKDGQMCNKEVYNWIIDNAIEFDQMINEFDFAWIHISLKKSKNRREVLEAYKDEDGDTKYRYAPDIITL
jgi:zinc D-Ala-D-Ala carboxypeptidase